MCVCLSTDGTLITGLVRVSVSLSTPSACGPHTSRLD